SIFLAKIIAHHTVNHEDTVAIERRGENLAPGQVAPFLGGDDHAGFEPAPVGGKCARIIRPGRGPAGDALGTTDALDEALAERVDCHEIGPHPFAHDLAIDVHHVSVADVIFVDDVAHFHARAELAALGLGAKNLELRGRKY